MADAIQQITDANGKNFSVDVSKICDINGDLGENASASITDSIKNRVHKIHDVEFVDQNGEVIDSIQLLKDISSGKTQVLALDVEMEATHSGKNHNYCVYYEDSMEKDAESFVNPFKKPMLKNHDGYSGEPLGRIIQSWFGPSALTDERSAIHLKARVTDQDAIPKFLDGRYGTVSIGGTMGTITCNICGKTILKDGKFKFCGHWRGESYKDQVCYWGAKDIEYHEVSTVNTPADDYAQIMKVTVITNSDDKKDNKEENTMAGTNTDNRSAEDVKKTVCDMIDQLLGSGAATSTSDSSEPSTVEDTKDGEDEAPATATDGENAEGGESQVTDSEIEVVKKELADANERVSALETELSETKDALAKAQEDLTTAQTEATDMKDKCMALATANKELVADSIIAKELASGSLTDETKDARKAELVAKSMKELNEMQKEADTSDSKETRQPAQVASPVKVSDNEDGNGKTADVNKKTSDDNAAKKTVDDFAQDIVGKLFK
jgi:hypothetical protein